MKRTFDPYLSRPDHRLDSNAKLVGIQGWPLDGALTTKSDFTGVTLTTRTRAIASVCWFIKSKPIKKVLRYFPREILKSWSVRWQDHPTLTWPGGSRVRLALTPWALE